MWRDARLTEMIFDKDKEISEEMKKKLAELEAKKNEKGEIVLDYDDMDEE